MQALQKRNRGFGVKDHNFGDELPKPEEYLQKYNITVV